MSEKTVNSKKFVNRKKSRRPPPEYSTRPYDGKTVKWEWKYEGELGTYPKDWARRFPHLAERGRWVITEIK